MTAPASRDSAARPTTEAALRQAITAYVHPYRASQLLSRLDDALAGARAGERRAVLGDVHHALAALDEVSDLAMYGDSIEAGLLEAHATLSTLADRLAALSGPADPTEDGS